ncbi:hypothetical protein [Sorangium sp. So ce385]|uniref:hypothetical protein n=1 Tax=Sorangium sp. So ce385 TaxID=3133308 RepID=UPI003F5C3343
MSSIISRVWGPPPEPVVAEVVEAAVVVEVVEGSVLPVLVVDGLPLAEEVVVLVPPPPAPPEPPSPSSPHAAKAATARPHNAKFKLRRKIRFFIASP